MNLVKMREINIKTPHIIYLTFIIEDITSFHLKTNMTKLIHDKTHNLKKIKQNNNNNLCEIHNKEYNSFCQSHRKIKQNKKNIKKKNNEIINKINKKEENKVKKNKLNNVINMNKSLKICNFIEEKKRNYGIMSYRKETTNINEIIEDIKNKFKSVLKLYIKWVQKKDVLHCFKANNIIGNKNLETNIYESIESIKNSKPKTIFDKLDNNIQNHLNKIDDIILNSNFNNLFNIIKMKINLENKNNKNCNKNNVGMFDDNDSLKFLNKNMNYIGMNTMNENHSNIFYELEFLDPHLSSETYGGPTTFSLTFFTQIE